VKKNLGGFNMAKLGKMTVRHGAFEDNSKLICQELEACSSYVPPFIVFYQIL